ncbi:MAG TPA: anion transporter [Bacteroidota bacterium]|nr:anion transporter [Bacteroidota bacterium]
MSPNIPLLVLTAVFILIAVRQVGTFRFQLWHIMTLGALAVLLTGQISFYSALRAIDLDVMLFLFGMFVIGQALEESGYLAHLSYKYFKRARTVDSLMLSILFGAGGASAFLMNDTLAIIGTPVILLLARKHRMSPTLFLLALCYAVTIGSVPSPIGNPQNLLIALRGGMPNPFITFLTWLFIPTVINLVIAYRVLKHFYRDSFHDAELSHSQEPIRNHELALLSRISLQIVMVLVGSKILAVAFLPSLDFPLTYIALTGALPILLGSKQRFRILRHVDWHTLVFFASMFVLMESVWQTGFLQSLLARTQFDLRAVPVILLVSVVVSQFISNVPLVALLQPLLSHAGIGTEGLMALAAGSTIAGNLFILGAASNIIVIQQAEKRSKQTITFWEFARVGIPLTFLNMLVYWLFILFVSAVVA